ncbi:MAG: tetratricopeptide repeat protein [Betaproteobacteria bacterium]|nr:tetratricopeptide repeat protein [Betaproteobacteria bacterium]
MSARVEDIPQAVAQAIQHYQAGRVGNAESLCRDILSSHPDQPDALHLLGVLVHQQGHHDQAETLVRRALVIRHEQPLYLNSLGTVLLARGKVQDAVQACQAALRLKPDLPQAHYNLGNALQRLGRHKKAVQAYAAALHGGHDFPEVHVSLGNSLQSLGRHEEAVQAFRAALLIRPNFPEAHYNLGTALLFLERVDEAAQAYQAALRIRPGFSEAHYNLGNALLSLGRHAEAAQAFQAALRIDPGSSDAHYNLGNALYGLKRHEEAAQAYRAALRARPDYPEAYLSLSKTLQALGRFEEAVAVCHTALSLNPQNLSNAYINLGNALLCLGRHEEAVQAFQAAVDAKPESAEAHCNLGTALGMLGMMHEAVPHYEAALRLQPDLLKAKVALADAWWQMPGRSQDALVFFQTLHAEQPGNAHVAVHLADVLEKFGRFQEAADVLRPLLGENMSYPRFITLYALVLSRLGESQQGIALLGQWLNSEEGRRTPLERRIAAHFLLGDIHDRLKHYDQAFLHYSTGNRLKPARFDMAKHTQIMDQVIAIFSAGFMAKAPRSGRSEPLPVFIVGMPRSGTSLVEQILASHPQVYGAGELPDLAGIAGHLHERMGSSEPYPACIPGVSVAVLDELAAGYLAQLRTLDPQAARVTDKMPHNFLRLGLVALLFPGARVIHCRRDPVDTCLSIYFHNFNNQHAYAYDLTHLGLYYREYERLMAHWTAVLDIPILELRYEDLVSDPESKTRELIAFCGLEWDDVCLNFHASERFVSTPSYNQVRQPIYKKSVARWRGYEKHLGELLAALGRS